MKVLEVAMEIALTPELLKTLDDKFGYRVARDCAMSTSVGGIGPLLRERIVEQANQGLDVIGVTLLYDKVWIQSWFNWGQLHLEKRDVGTALRNVLEDTGITFSLPFFDGPSVDVQVWKLAYGKATVYFLDAPEIGHVVYPGEEDAPAKTPQPAAWGDDLRHRQSWLVGRGALALCKALKFTPDVTLLSETPTYLAHHRVAKDAFQNDPFFEKTRYIFNDHTPLEYAHPIWPRDLLNRLKVDVSGYVPPAGTPETGPVDITRWLIAKADGVFGVAKKHGDVMRAMPSLRDYKDKIQFITNGVYAPYWQAPVFQQLDRISDNDLLAKKDELKDQLLDWIWRHYGLWPTWKDQCLKHPVALWTRRITGYKRLDLMGAVCRDARLRQRFIDSGVILFIGGRIHQHDDQAQGMVYDLLDRIMTDPVLKERIVFLDNFNVWMAPRLFQGADAAVMLADDGREASATGFMKAQMNGDLIIATEDGAIPESVLFAGREKNGQIPNGLEVPYVQGHPTAEGLIQAFEKLGPLLTDRTRRAATLRAAVSATAQVSVSRTSLEMAAFYKKI